MISNLERHVKQLDVSIKLANDEGMFERARRLAVAKTKLQETILWLYAADPDRGLLT